MVIGSIIYAAFLAGYRAGAHGDSLEESFKSFAEENPTNPPLTTTELLP